LTPEYKQLTLLSKVFVTNQAQILVLNKIKRAWKAGKKVRIIIIKGRQQGMSTLIQILQLALCITTKGWQAYTMTHRLDLAKDIFEQKIKYAYDYLPENFKNLLGASKNNVRQLMFANIDKSTISVGTSGRGGTYQSIHISEGGKMSESPETWSEMINGTLEAGSEADLIIHESTADGGLGLFYEFVNDNLNDVLFLSWTVQNEYQLLPPISDDTWYDEYKQLAINYKLCSDPMTTYKLSELQFYWYFYKAKQLKSEIKVQYPLSLEEAFVASSECYFNPDILEEFKKQAKPIHRIWEGYTIYTPPISGHKYALVCDCSTGESNDYSAIKIVDINTLEEVAKFKGKLKEAELAQMIAKGGALYNQAYIAIEINNIGRAVQEYVLNLGYDQERIYKRWITDTTNPRLPKIQKLGYETTGKTRPLMLSELRTLWESGELIINDPETYQEAKTFCNNGKGKYEAISGHNDDLIMCSAIIWQCIKWIHESQ
jgi:hypothetical protein